MNLVVTNVPGPRLPLYLAGAPLLELFPVVPILANLRALNQVMPDHLRRVWLADAAMPATASAVRPDRSVHGTAHDLHSAPRPDFYSGHCSCR